MTAAELAPPADEPAITADDLTRLPIFPLPNAVLLPGGLMPLHVFEPRYRDMVRDALAGSGLLAIARLRPGYERDYHGRPPVFPRAGAGRIIASDETPDGRYLIVVRGLARVEVRHEHPPERSYREVAAQLLTDVAAPPEALRAAHRRLLMLCERLSQAMDRGGTQLRALLASCDCAGACADAIAAALVFDHDQRQDLLERLDPVERVERVAEHVGRLLCELVPCAGQAN
jgi:hypothetical protein